MRSTDPKLSGKGNYISTKKLAVKRGAISLVEAVRANLREHNLLDPGQRILVAVSGGVDSMVLLSVLHGLSKELRLKLTVAHLNHRLRGISSNADERLVVRTARNLRVPVVVDRIEVKAALKFGVSLEMAARKARHEFLARCARERGINKIALAHHLDDQVELFFLRLLRGCGSQALAGMKWKGPSSAARSITLVRPLLDRPKTLLRQYAAENRVQYREDASNASLDIQRNRIRHELLPMLRRIYQPGLDRGILRIMDILGAEADFVTKTALSFLAAKHTRKPSSKEKEQFLHPGGVFESFPIAIQRRCLQLQLEALRVLPDFELIEHLRKYPGDPIEVSRAQSTAFLQEEQGSQEPEKKNALRLIRKDSQIRSVGLSNGPSFGGGSVQVDLEKTRKVDWEGVRLTWKTQKMAGQKLPPKEPGQETFDADRVGKRVEVRHWRPGDRFQPIGMPEAIKVQDLFVNQKVPRSHRHRLLVACMGDGEIFWIEGLRISERFKLTKATIRRLQWRWQRL